MIISVGAPNINQHVWDLITFLVRYFVISDIGLSKPYLMAVDKNGIKMGSHHSGNKGCGYDWVRFSQLLYQFWLLHNSKNSTRR